MAETTKRNSAGSSRGSTPKPSQNPVDAKGPGDQGAALRQAIGARVKLSTSTAPTLTLEGTLFAACPKTNLLAINTSASSANPTPALSNYHLVPISHISTFDILALAGPNSATGPASFDAALPSVARVDLRAAKVREEQAIRRIREQDAKRGRGVGKEAQEIFDALDRTNTIIVNDCVRIDPPYGPDDCAAPKDKQDALARVRKVLENERRKIAERAAAGKGSNTAPPPLPPPGTARKGG